MDGLLVFKARVKGSVKNFVRGNHQVETSFN
jgi:hypothetical protein